MPGFNCLPEGESLIEMARRNHWRAIDIRFCRNIAAHRNDDTFGTDMEVCEPREAEIATVYAFDDLGEAFAIHDVSLNAAGADDLSRVTRELYMAILEARREPSDAAQRHQAEQDAISAGYDIG